MREILAISRRTYDAFLECTGREQLLPVLKAFGMLLLQFVLFFSFVHQSSEKLLSRTTFAPNRL